MQRLQSAFVSNFDIVSSIVFRASDFKYTELLELLMFLGLHTYSLHLHGRGQHWGGFKLQ